MVCNLINTRVILLFFGGIIMSCSPPTGEEIVLKSLEFHGGLDRWENYEQLSYLKHSTLFYQDGSVESDVTATYTHTFTPAISSSKKWIKNDTVYSYKLTNNPEQDVANFIDQTAYIKAKNDLDGAFYVVWQPYKLLESKEALEYIGQDILEDQTKVNIVKLQYYNKDGSKDNTWWFYFGEKTHRIEGYMVKHDSTYAYVRNHTYESVTGLSLCQTRTSYRVDSLRTIQYIRGKYHYDFHN